MSKWDALKCLLGRHDGTRWRIQYGVVINPEPVKRQRRFCTRCGTAETRPWQGRIRTPSKESV